MIHLYNNNKFLNLFLFIKIKRIHYMIMYIDILFKKIVTLLKNKCKINVLLIVVKFKQINMDIFDDIYIKLCVLKILLERIIIFMLIVIIKLKIGLEIIEVKF